MQTNIKSLLALLLVAGSIGLGSCSKEHDAKPAVAAVTSSALDVITYRITGTNTPYRGQVLKCYYLPSSSSAIDVNWAYEQGDGGFTFGQPQFDNGGNYIVVTCPDEYSIVSFSAWRNGHETDGFVDKILQVN